MKKSKHQLIGPISLLTVGFLFGISGVIAKHLSDHLTAYQVIEYRFGIALIGALLISIAFKQKINFTKIRPQELIPFAITFPLSVIFFTLAIFNTTVSLSVFSFYIATLVSSFIIGRVYFGEEVTPKKKIALALMLLSLVLFTNPFSDFTIELGLVYGVISGLLQGIASTYQKKLSNNASKVSLLVIQTAIGAVIAAVILLFVGDPLLPNLSIVNWIISVIFGVSMLAIAYLFLVGFKYTKLNTGSILVSSELIFGPLFAFILLSEDISANVLIGGALTIAAAVLVNLSDKKA